jgi:hypothetical protein
MLESEDIQHFLIARPHALAARYEFLSFRKAVAGRAWLTGVIEKVGTAKSVASSELDSRWITVAFTWNGLSRLGVDESSLANFPEEFRQGARGSLAQPERTTPIIGWEVWRAPICTLSSSCLPAMSPNVNDAG